MNKKFSTIVVTGANRGIGLEITRRLDAEGYSVAACIRSESKELNKIVDNSPDRHSLFRIDMEDEKSIRDGARELLRWSGNTAGLVNCAGVASGNLFLMTKMEELRRVYQINFLGPLMLTQYIARKMLTAKYGSIVNISSTAGILGDPGTLCYGGSKASLIHATRVMANELGAYGIRVNAIAPSVVESDMAELMDTAARAKLDGRSALHGKIKPKDVSDLVSFLLSEASVNISGQVIRIDRAMPF